MSQILPAFTRRSFRTHCLNVIYAWIREDHMASVRVAERAGYRRDSFPFEAELAQSLRRPGFIRYAIFRDMA
jgi:RimJ/RimL family protein N-acetyltransferase